MPRKSTTVVEAPAEQHPQALLLQRVIHVDAVHPLTEWGSILGLPRHTLKREARLGRLRVSRRAGRLWATGLWMLEWIRGGEVRRRRAAEVDQVADGAPAG